MHNKVKQLRAKLNLTQSELAESSGISLRTIQRIEAGAPLKGFTLKSLANTLGVEPNQLFESTENLGVEKAKKINFSALAGFIIPFGNIIFPLILLSKTKDPINRELGKGIISTQILVSVLLSTSMIICPFIQKFLHLNFPLFLPILGGFMALKLLIIMLNGVSLNKNKSLNKILKINFL